MQVMFQVNAPPILPVPFPPLLGVIYGGTAAGGRLGGPVIYRTIAWTL